MLHHVQDVFLYVCVYLTVCPQHCSIVCVLSLCDHVSECVCVCTLNCCVLQHCGWLVCVCVCVWSIQHSSLINMSVCVYLCKIVYANVMQLSGVAQVVCDSASECVCVSAISSLVALICLYT